MNQNMLKLNPSKTEFMIIGNLTQRKKVAHIFPVELLNQNFAEIDSIRNLGVAFDPAFSFKKHVSNISSPWYYTVVSNIFFKSAFMFDLKVLGAYASCIKFLNFTYGYK